MKPGACASLLLVATLLSAPAGAATVRYDRAQNLIVVDQGAVVTLTTLKAILPEAPIQRVDEKRRIWLLGANVLLTSGSTLRLYGSRAGGDVDELRLRSDNGPSGAFVALTADHGTFDIRATRVTSWDSTTRGPDTQHDNGRAFIRARSRMRSMMLIPLQSRMDIVDSEVSHLGYNANESYGLSWKVVAPEPFVFEYVRVYGNVLRSNIHDNYFGLYAFGGRAMEWRGNRVHHNVQYGLAPHTRSDDLHIEDNDVHENGNHGITVRQHCARVVIRNNRVWANGESGITLHRGSNGGLIAENQVFHNAETGIIVYASSGVTVRSNVVRDNAHIGVQLAMGSSNNRIEGNEIRGNGFYGLFVGKGRGKARDGGDGQPRGNQIANNRIYGSGAENLRAIQPALNTWSGNQLTAPPAPVPAKARGMALEGPPARSPGPDV